MIFNSIQDQRILNLIQDVVLNDYIQTDYEAMAALDFLHSQLLDLDRCIKMIQGISTDAAQAKVQELRSASEKNRLDAYKIFSILDQVCHPNTFNNFKG